MDSFRVKVGQDVTQRIEEIFKGTKCSVLLKHYNRTQCDIRLTLFLWLIMEFSPLRSRATSTVNTSPVMYNTIEHSRLRLVIRLLKVNLLVLTCNFCLWYLEIPNEIK